MKLFLIFGDFPRKNITIWQKKGKGKKSLAKLHNCATETGQQNYKLFFSLKVSYCFENHILCTHIFIFFLFLHQIDSSKMDHVDRYSSLSLFLFSWLLILPIPGKPLTDLGQVLSTRYVFTCSDCCSLWSCYLYTNNPQCPLLQCVTFYGYDVYCCHRNNQRD